MERTKREKAVLTIPQDRRLASYESLPLENVQRHLRNLDQKQDCGKTVGSTDFAIHRNLGVDLSESG
jgi:hypothetical protein